MISKKIFEMQAQLCRAMGHPVRLEIVHILKDSPQCVSSLAKIMRLNQAILSRHLAVLRNHRIVKAQRQGQENVYHLANPKIIAVCDLMRQVLVEELTRQSEIADTLAERD